MEFVIDTQYRCIQTLPNKKLYPLKRWNTPPIVVTHDLGSILLQKIKVYCKRIFLMWYKNEDVTSKAATNLV